MDSKTVKLPIHKHLVSALTRFIRGYCFGCHIDENIYNGYLCNEYNCFALFHKECAEAPSEINHPSHPEHHILLTNDSGDGPCDLCGQNLSPPCYSCSTCEFKVDLICGMKPSPLAIEHPACHDHPLAFLKKRDDKSSCSVCKESIDGPSYSCIQCNNVYFHVGCVQLSKVVNYPCHSNHPLKLINASDTLEEKMCILCQLTPRKGLYHCSKCNFTICIYCTKNPPPLVVEHTKTHKHPLTLFSRNMPFTCDACGEEDNGGIYLCLQCAFVIHGKCINLPRVINTNRHDHRISFTYHLGTKILNCGVCRKSINQYHGGYTCSVCPNYATHSRCVVNWVVWDGVDLEGIPNDAEDDDTKSIAPYKVVGDNLISHFSHNQHPLKLYNNYIMRSEWLQCEACMYPLGCESFYCCEICGFVLHEKCASLPKKKRLIFDPVPFKLYVSNTFLNCDMCRTLCDGFMYTTQDNRVADVHCGSLSEPFNHQGHPHPLYFDEIDGLHHCDACESDVNGNVLRCDDCRFKLCFYCASLPVMIWYRNDEHFLALYCGENPSYNNWCDNCEIEINQCKWFYTCSDCGVTFHARCVVGDFSRLKLESLICFEEKDFKVVLNNHNTRPICCYCHSRCNFSIILKNNDEDNMYICSRACLLSSLG